MMLPTIILAEGSAYALAGVVAGVLLCFIFLRWKDQKNRQAQASEAQSIVEKAKRDSENMIRDARLIANEEALSIRTETEKSFAARRQERADQERRLAERESLLNT